MKNVFLGNTVCLISIITSEDYIHKTILAMKKSLDSFTPTEAVLICPPNNYSGNWYGIKQINLQINQNEYSEWIVKKLYQYINCDYCITMQWDSCVLDGLKWSNDFLNFSYIGACWQNPFINRVGNGGFALRSKRFLEETSKLNYVKTNNFIINNEDVFSCVLHYEYLTSKGIKFAPLMLARQFSVERPIAEAPHEYDNIKTYNSFAFHGDFCNAGMKYIND